MENLKKVARDRATIGSRVYAFRLKRFGQFKI